MKTKEIERGEWSAFFDLFSRQHEGWTMTLEILGSEIGAQIQERELVFEGIVADWNEVRGDQIAIMAGEKPDDHITHRIGRPIQVSFEYIDEATDGVIMIISADGVTSLLRFHCPMFPKLVEGLADQLSQAPL